MPGFHTANQYYTQNIKISLAISLSVGAGHAPTGDTLTDHILIISTNNTLTDHSPTVPGWSHAKWTLAQYGCSLTGHSGWSQTPFN